MLRAVHFGAAILASFGVACASTVDVRIDQRKDLAGYCTWNFLSLGDGNVHAPLSDAREARREADSSSSSGVCWSGVSCG